MEFRMILCFFMSLAIVLFVMPYFITFLKRLSLRQTISEYSLEEDQKKAGTPIMGGVLFIIVPIIVTLLLSKNALHDKHTLIVMLAYLGYGLIGFLDDYLIAIKKNNDGLIPRYKFALQLLLAIIFFFFYRSQADLSIRIPFTETILRLGVGYFILILFMFTGSSNAVNLTDGMDGLAAGSSIIAFVPFLIFSLVDMQYRDIALFILSVEGALLGYLYYNKKPARVFMGDTGSLALGGLLAALAMVMKKELALILIAGLFVIETLCVIIQIASVKIRHKRVFPYTPIHYAFRLAGMPETSVVHLFWLVELIFACLGLWVGLH